MPSAFAHSQGQVMVLGPIACRIQQADLVEHTASHREHMTDVVVVPQQVKVEIGLEERIEVPPVLPLLVLVAVQQVRIGMLEHGECVFVEEVGLYQVVVIEEAHEIARCGSDAGVRVRRYPSVLLKSHDLDPFVGAARRSNRSGKLLVFRAGVDQDQLPPGVRLRPNRLHHLVEEPARGLVQGNHDAENRGALQRRLALHAKHGLVGAMFLEPRRVAGIDLSVPGQCAEILQHATEQPRFEDAEPRRGRICHIADLEAVVLKRLGNADRNRDAGVREPGSLDGLHDRPSAAHDPDIDAPTVGADAGYRQILRRGGSRNDQRRAHEEAIVIRNRRDELQVVLGEAKRTVVVADDVDKLSVEAVAEPRFPLRPPSRELLSECVPYGTRRIHLLDDERLVEVDDGQRRDAQPVLLVRVARQSADRLALRAKPHEASIIDRGNAQGDEYLPMPAAQAAIRNLHEHAFLEYGKPRQNRRARAAQPVATPPRQRRRCEQGTSR